MIRRPRRPVPRPLVVSAAILFAVTLAWCDDAEREHWAYTPLAPVEPPAVASGGSPIDRFVAARLVAAGLSPAPRASRRELVRRLFFGLHGLPPSPEDIAELVDDESPDALEKLVDRLLASPRFGERQARHWLDLVHYAETHGHDQDRPRPHAWPYRDWVIGALNHDKPYGEFVAEQVAGDVLPGSDGSAVAATGFLAAGPWDESSLLNIVDDTIDKTRAQYLDRDDMIATTFSTFVSTTLHCARCHGHKFDPISQADYYRVQAVFAGVDKANRSWDPDPSTRARRRELEEERRRLADARDGDPVLVGEAAARRVTEWEAELSAEAARWRPLLSPRVESEAGQEVSALDDGSFLFGGPRPERDTYVVSGASAGGVVTAIRVETLLHDSLPHGGPGRQDNGNLHLSEVRCFLETPESGERSSIALHAPSADFDQAGWTAAHAVDGDEATAWGIYPRVGVAHHAVFVLAQPVELGPRARLVVVLAQKHGGGHLIGRVRVSTTDSPGLPRASALPEELRALLTRSSGERSAEERARLARHVLLEDKTRALAALPQEMLVYAAASDFAPEGNFRPAATPRTIHVLRRGEVERPGREIGPGTLDVLPWLAGEFEIPQGAPEGARRVALARWLADERNALTWRSIANRVWMGLLGRPIVETPSDFGLAGAAPTHPALLDWLAAELLASGGSLKRLHRTILLSETWARSSAHFAEAARVDPENRLLWRGERRRIEAEVLRDTLLALAGDLDLRMGGPSAKQFVERPGKHVTPDVDYDALDLDSPEARRRSAYRFVFRTMPDPLLATFDCVDASQLTPRRNESVTPLQALALLNDRFVVHQASRFAARVARERRGLRGQVAWAFELAMCRPPSAAELDLLHEHAGELGLASTCRLIVNASELLYVD